MTNDVSLDDRRDRMVSALYGELSPAELKKFEAEIADDPKLSAEFNELRSVQRLIQLADTSPANMTTHTAPPPTRSFRSALAGVFSSRLAASGLGFAAAASLFFVLLIGGLRVDQTPEGWLVRLDGSLRSDFAVASNLDSGDSRMLPQGISHAEMAELTQILAGATAARLDQLERRQVESQVNMTRALYDALFVQQEQQYADLRNRIERVAYTAGAGSLAGPYASTGKIIRGGMNDGN